MKKKEAEKISEKIMPQNFPNLTENINVHIQEVHWNRSIKNKQIKKTTSRHSQRTESQSENLESSYRKMTHCAWRGAVRLIADFSSEYRIEIIKVLKENNCQLRRLYQENYPSQLHEK